MWCQKIPEKTFWQGLLPKVTLIQSYVSPRFFFDFEVDCKGSHLHHTKHILRLFGGFPLVVTTKFSQTRWLQDARASSSAVLAYAAATCCFERIHIIAAVVFHHLSPTMLVRSSYEVEELTLSACGQSTWLVGLFFSYSEWILLHPVAKGNGIWMFFFLFFFCGS